MELVYPTAEDLERGRLLQEVAMERRKNMSMIKLNDYDIMIGHCRYIKSEEGMRRAKDDLCLTSTMESIKAKELKRPASKKQEK